MKRAATWLIGLLMFTALPAIAATPPAGQNLIRIQRCAAEHNKGREGGYEYRQYTPGYYPQSGPYGWYDPYGKPYYQATLQGGGTLFIDYVNATHKEMKLIDFGLLGAYDNVLAEVRDNGHFSPGAEIKHKFGVSTRVFPLVTPAVCMPLHIVYADGTTWTHPHLPPAAKSLHSKEHS